MSDEMKMFKLGELTFTQVLLPVDFDEMVKAGRAEVRDHTGEWRRVVRAHGSKIVFEAGLVVHTIDMLRAPADGPILRYVPPEPLPVPFKRGTPPHNNLCLLLEGNGTVQVGRWVGNEWSVCLADPNSSGVYWRVSFQLRGWAELVEVIRE